jgi:hypothetical protein
VSAWLIYISNQINLVQYIAQNSKIIQYVQYIALHIRFVVVTSLSQSPKAAQFALIFITMIWGGTFLAVQYALNFSSPMFFVGCRFAIAALAIFLISMKSMRGLNLKDTCRNGDWYRDCDWLWHPNHCVTNDFK